MTIWDTLATLTKKRTEERIASYAEGVQAVAAGKQTDPTLTLDILEKAGKSIGDLRAAVEQIHRRARLVKEYAKLPTIRAELEEIAARVAELNREAAALREAHQAEFAQLAPREQALEIERRRLEGEVRSELEATAGSEALAAHVAAQDHVADLHRQRGEVSSELAGLIRGAGPIETRAAQEKRFRPDPDDVLAERQERTARLPQLERDLAALDRQIAQAKRKEEAARLALAS